MPIAAPPDLRAARERLIVALDVPSGARAMALVDELGDDVVFYKIGLELLIAGGAGDLLRALAARGHQVFVDFKLPNDIPATVRSVVRVASELGARFLTLSHSASPATIRAAVEGRGGRSLPELLFVPVLSSLDASDFARESGRSAADFRSDLLQRATDAKQLGADGFIVSGQEIAVLREAFPGVRLVSPGIRPAGASTDDHKRSCTPGQAIRLGADCIVVGRPIREAAHRRDAAKRIVDEIAAALAEAPARSGARSGA